MFTLNTGATVYEYIITFDQEVSQVWSRKPTATSFLLLSTRWVIVLTQVIGLVPSTPSTCKSLSCMMCTK